MAELLALVPVAKLPIQYDLGFIATLDCGTNQEQVGRVVNSYALAWWKVTRRPAEGGILDGTTLEACLKHHRRQLLQTMAGDPIPEVPIITIPSLQLLIHANASHADGTADANANADADIGCKTYLPLAGDLLNELRSLKNFTSGLAESALNKTDVSSHEAQGFYILHEKVQLKEMHQESINVDANGPGSRTQKSRHVREIAQKTFERLRDMPPASYKWTWGETLTRDEVLDLRSDPKQRLHSGYEISLKEGGLEGVASSMNTAPTGPANYSPLRTESHIPPPSTSQHFPMHFGSYKTTPPSLPSLQSLSISVPTSHNPVDSGHALVTMPIMVTMPILVMVLILVTVPTLGLNPPI